MYRIAKQFAFSASHQLHLPYDSPCNRLHGHNYTVEIVLANDRLNGEGMVLDYAQLAPFAQYISENLDHRFLNDIVPEPTAEYLAKHLYDVAFDIYGLSVAEVRVSETPKTWASYRPGHDA